MSIVIQCPYLVMMGGISKLCMNGRFPCDCERCSCLDRQYVEVTTTTSGTSAWPNYLKGEEVMGRIWAAHDKNAFTVWLYNERPVLNKDAGCFCSKAEDIVGNVDESLLPDVTYENSPIEYEIIFKKPKAMEE